MKNFKLLQKKIGIFFKDQKILETAFVHRSYLNEHKKFPLPHNERLEFLGDAVLELVVTEYLYQNYQNPEGELTNWRAALVRGETISQIAKNLDFNDYLYLSRGEAKSEGKARDLILANTFEAFIGALYLDQGLEEVREFIIKNLIPELKNILKKNLHKDAKSRLQEIAQEKFKVTPYYKVLKEEGPDHNKTFTVGVYLEDEMIDRGKGASKQEAELVAAQKALKKYPFE